MTNSDAGRQRVTELEEAEGFFSVETRREESASASSIFLFLFLFSCHEVTRQVRAAARRRAFSMRAFNEKNNG
jgi:hypothetical protein